MLIGYARVSSDDQDTAAQVAALKAAKCERIYGELASAPHRTVSVGCRSRYAAACPSIPFINGILRRSCRQLSRIGGQPLTRAIHGALQPVRWVWATQLKPSTSQER